VCCHSRQQAEQVRARLAGWLAARGLAFNEAKTRIVHLSEGFDFLGFSLRRYPNGKLLIKPGAAAIKRFRKRLAGEFRELRGTNAEAVLATIVPVTRGWSAYYKAAVSSRTFSALDAYLWKLTYKWACWTHPNKPKRWITRQYYRRFSKFRNDRWVFGNPDTGLPAETGLDSDRAAHPGQGRRVPGRPVPGRVLGKPPPEGETPARPLRRAPAGQAGRAVRRVRGKSATGSATPVP